METLHQRAERLAGRAGELLELSPETRVRVEAESTYDLPNNYFLRLSEIADTQPNPDGLPDSNSSALYIYQQPDVESEDCSPWPYLYCDIQALRTGKFEGRINIPLEKDEILVNVSPYSPIHHLLSVAYLAAEHAGAGADLAPAEIDELTEFFRFLLEGGGEVRTEDAFQKLPDGSAMLIKSQNITGSLPEANEAAVRLKPQLRVARVERPTRYQLEFLGEGRYESFVRLADELEHQAQYAPAEGVVRNDSGKIICVTSSGDHKTVLIEAERATGLRDLDPEILDKIEEGLGQWALKNADL